MSEFLCPHSKNGALRFALVCPFTQKLNFVTKVYKWGHLCRMDTFLVYTCTYIWKVTRCLFCLEFSPVFVNWCFISYPGDSYLTLFLDYALILSNFP